MKYVFNESFDIDVSYIWKYECDRFIHYEVNEENFKIIKELYFFLQNFYFKYEHKPFLKFSDIKEGKATLEYYNIQLRDYRDFINDVLPLESITIPNHFMSGDDFYDMHQQCIIEKKDLNYSDFEKLFALKLRQYYDGLNLIEDFFNHQLKNNFNRDRKSFKAFLKYLLLHHKNLIDKEIVQVSNDWMAEAELKFAEKSLRKSATDIKNGKSKKETARLNKPDGKNSDHSEIPPEANGDNEDANENKIPNGYKVIKGKFSLKEINKYFSFLYIEKSNRDEPFLPEKDVKKIFRYGIAIPISIHIQKVKLNCTKAFPKSIIEFCIYKFYEKHSKSNNQKVDILKFFSFYFKDFEKHGQNKDKLLQWSTNVTGEKPLRMKFDIEKYLPTETKDTAR